MSHFGDIVSKTELEQKCQVAVLATLCNDKAIIYSSTELLCINVSVQSHIGIITIADINIHTLKMLPARDRQLFSIVLQETRDVPIHLQLFPQRGLPRE